MRYSTQQKFRKYFNRYGFLSFAKKFGDKYGKKLMDTATKTGIDAAKPASKIVVQKTEKEEHEIYISPERRQQVIDDFRLF